MNSEESNDFMDSSAFVYPVVSHIPIDLFISRKRKGLTRGDIIFSDASDNLIFRVDGRSSKSSVPSKRVLVDAKGNPLISIYRNEGGWQGFRGDSKEWKDLMLRVERSINKSHWRKEVAVSVVVGNRGDSTPSDFKIKGCPFQRSCTIYKDNSIVAQTSLLYKLGKILVGRRRFRLTIFPGFNDHALLVALIVTFFNRQI